VLTRRRATDVLLDWPVFPDSMGGHRVPQHNIFRIFRKILATILDGDGQTTRRIADQLGHSRLDD
jgi:hypothetical protein